MSSKSVKNKTNTTQYTQIIIIKNATKTLKRKSDKIVAFMLHASQTSISFCFELEEAFTLQVCIENNNKITEYYCLSN